MRSTLALGLAAVLATGALVPTGAEAGGRRRVRPVGIGSAASGLVRSDDALRVLLAATPQGGTLRLPAGTYRTSLVIDRPMVIVGAAGGTTLDAADLGRPAIEILPGVRDVAIEAVRVFGATGDGILAGAGCDRLRLVRVAAHGCGGAGVHVLASDDVTIETSSFDENGGPGLDLDGARARVARCAFGGNGIAAARVRGEDASLRECAFTGGTDGVLVEGPRAEVFRCGFRTLGVGVRVTARGDAATIARCDGRALVTLVLAEAGSSHARILENRVAGASGDGVRAQGAGHRVEGNTIEDAAGAGVALDGDLGVVAGNTVRRCGTGVHVIAGSGNRVEANSCEGCLGPDLVDEGSGTTFVGARVR